MTSIKPDYFDSIQQKSSNRWQQLEQDHELAAPWHQLFQQVQSPRHVLSELLQNADDAKATEVAVHIENGVFSFVHHGKDFNEEDFASLCRFGYSNKRLLRTIGFRGVGFKSTFSLADTIRLCTPTLSVAFNKKRFTEPVWYDDKTTKDGSTQILVEIEETQRQKELENNIQEWLNSPFSLLFFNHIRHLKLGDHDLSWKSLGVGPTPASEWMTLESSQEPYLIVRSTAEPFPKEALKELREERLLEMGESTDLPPCSVEIVLRAPGHFFVVLPTGVKTTLPFAVNAPFVQDPARLKIKDPEISYTNRWLLQRIGKLAAETMFQWLEREDLDTKERAKAYDLMPMPNAKDDSLESACKSVVEEAFMQTLLDSSYLLTDEGELETVGRCASVPPVIWDIWTGEQIATVLNKQGHKPVLLSRFVSAKNQQKLQANQSALAINQEDILNILTIETPPKPTTWASLLELWKLASQWRHSWKGKSLNIHPVRGKSVLYSAKNVARLGEKKLLQSEEDWDFLARHLLVIDVNWLRYLTEQRRVAEEGDNKDLGEKVAAADQLIVSTELDKPSNVDTVIEQVAKEFYSEGNPKFEDCIRFTQIAAKLNAKIGSSFLFITRDGVLRPASDLLLFDETGKLDEFIPDEAQELVLLHDKYFHTLISCSREDWLSWIYSGNAGVKTFIPLHKRPQAIWGTQRIEKEVKARGYTGILYFPYVTSQHEIEDWDFPAEYWRHWELCAKADPTIWGRLIEQFLHQPKILGNVQVARVFQIATTGNRKLMTNEIVLPTWLLKLRALPCLRDTQGRYRQPGELMCRTPQTEPLMDVEPFVDARLDSEATRPILNLLGVRSLPTGPRQILERLRALAQTTKPPLLELAKWYQRLDTMFDDCSTDDQQEIISFFNNERLIFAEDGSWQTAKSAYITTEENDVPDTALIHSSSSQFSLWRKIGVNERPTVELAIHWLEGLPSGEKPSSTDLRRVKALLGRHPLLIWQTCEHWLNLVGEWVPLQNLRHALTMQSLTPWEHFHEQVKLETADLRMLSASMTREHPFSTLPSLASQVEKRLQNPTKQGYRLSLPWLQTLGGILTRIRFDDDTQTQRIRAQAARLAEIGVVQLESINTIPYLNGNPAGLPEKELLAWVDQTLYITNLSQAKLARLISERIARAFDWPEMEALLSYSFERSEEVIRAYVEENFSLGLEETVSPAKQVVEQQPKNQITDPIGTPPSINPVQGNILLIESSPGSSPEKDQNEPGEGKVTSHPARQTQTRIPLIERFAIAQGFHKDDSHQFSHSNGSVLIKSDGLFTWLIQESNGAVLRYFWPKEHCLEIKSLEIPTEIWHLIEQSPQQHALLLEDRNGNPIQKLGSDLLTSKQRGTLKLYPAAYRLTLEIDD